MKVPAQVKLLMELHRLETKRKDTCKGEGFKKIKNNLDPSLLKQYIKLKERKGTGTAVLKNRMCSACRMVYPETHGMLLCGDSVHTCEFCGRLLVVNGKAG